MKQILTCLIVYCLSCSIFAQKSSPKLSFSDSLKAKSYWDSANQALLYSQKRQAYLDKALVIEPWNAFYWQQKAMPLYKQKKYEIGKPFLDSAVKYNRKKYTDYRAFMTCLFQKNYRLAINYFNDAEAILPNGYVMDHSYHFYKGLSYLQLNQFDSSIHFIQKSIDYRIKTFGPKWVQHNEYLFLGINYYEKGDYNSAIHYFDKALELYSNFPDAKYYKALAILIKGDKKSALELFKQCKTDLESGYTMNEDNLIYEDYPYQISMRKVDYYIKSLTK